MTDIPAWETVPAEWRRFLRDDLEALRAGRFIVATGQQSDSHPCINQRSCRCWHERIPGSRRFFCTCPDPDCPDFTLDTAALQILRLDVARLAEAVREALSVKRPARRLPQYNGTFALGTYHPAPSVSFPAFLVLPSSSEGHASDIAALASSHDRPIAVAVFSRAMLDASLETSLRNRVLFVVLSETLALDHAGKLACLAGRADPLRPIYTPAVLSLSHQDSVRAVQLAQALDATPRRKGPTTLQYILAVSKGHSRSQIARDYRCSPSQVTAVKNAFQEQFGMDPAALMGVHGDLEDTVKSIHDPRAKRIHQRTAISGREEDDDG